MANLNPDRLGEIRSDWSLAEARELFRLPFNDLLFHAQRVHRQHFDPNQVQVSTLLSIKTGGCPEDCAYCPQSVRYDTGVEREALLRRRRSRGSSEAGEGGWRDAVLHGGGLSQPQAAAAREHQGHGARGERAGSRDLRDARDARARAGTRAQGGRPRLLQPQPRHVRGVLRRDHHDPHLPGPPRHARGGARGGAQRLLRRDPRHGRVGIRPDRAAAYACDPAAAPGKRADQPARAGAGHAAARPAAARSARPRAHDRGGAPA